ncbi:purine/pyrimidine permease [Peribacillus frigoritolerans]|nr:purine/pyrimidine permease [Peribacillus frigoritolerans]
MGSDDKYGHLCICTRIGFCNRRGGIATGILLAGAVTILLAAFNLIYIIQKVIKPMVISVYIFLLTFQLIFIFFKGMFKITESGTIDLPVSLFSILIVIFVGFLRIKGGKILGNFSILIGIIVGWSLYRIIFPSDLPTASSSGMAFTFFPLGTPNLNIGIIFCFLFCGPSEFNEFFRFNSSCCRCLQGKGGT